MDAKDSKVLLFKLTANPILAEEVAQKLHLQLSLSEVDHFADGEVLARPLCSVRDQTVYVIQSTANPVSERLMELLVFIDGLKNANAKEINLVIPYYGFCRQDRITREGEPITAKLVAKILEAAGVNLVITMDLHSPQIQGFFSCPVDALSPTDLFAQYYQDKLAKLGIATQDVCVVSPDHGSLHRARNLASKLPNSTLAVIDKRRPTPNKAEVVNVVGEVKDKVCIIIDDIIDTAGTVLACADCLFARGAKKIFVGGTHGIFSQGAADRLLKSKIEDIVITDSIEQNIKGINAISLAPMIAGVIEATEEGRPIPDSWMDFH
jgi:ribose-phosphate pyrophosphokinase